jgi:hypothetical protein
MNRVVLATSSCCPRDSGNVVYNKHSRAPTRDRHASCVWVARLRFNSSSQSIVRPVHILHPPFFHFHFLPLPNFHCKSDGSQLTALVATMSPTTMLAVSNAAVDIALFVLRVVSPSLILLTTLSLLAKRPSPPPSPSSITAVTVAARIPRRGLILYCLFISSLIYFFDGLVFVVCAVIEKYWPPRTGIEVNAIIGLVAFAGLAAFGSWKDVQGVDVWLLGRLKISIFFSLILDVAQVILYGISMPRESTHSSPPTSHRSSTRRYNRSASSLPISVRYSKRPSSDLANFAHSSSCPIVLRLDQPRGYLRDGHVGRPAGVNNSPPFVFT